MHGFDEFFGNLYHLNAEEEPENPDYPKDPRFRQKFGPRGVLRCYVIDKDDTTVDPAYGKVGKQRIENTARSTPSAWKRSTMNSPTPQWPGWISRPKPASRSSVTTTPRVCTSSPT